MLTAPRLFARVPRRRELPPTPRFRPALTLSRFASGRVHSRSSFQHRLLASYRRCAIPGRTWASGVAGPFARQEYPRPFLSRAIQSAALAQSPAHHQWSPSLTPSLHSRHGDRVRSACAETRLAASLRTYRDRCCWPPRLSPTLLPPPLSGI